VGTRVPDDWRQVEGASELEVGKFGRPRLNGNGDDEIKDGK
jgi:hypothetical protein